MANCKRKEVPMLLKTALFVVALALGSYSASAAFLNGTLLIPGLMGYLAGGGLVALMAWSGLAGLLMTRALAEWAWMRSLVLLGHWSFATACVLIMSVGYVSYHRGNAVSERQMTIDSYSRAEADWQRLNTEIQAADTKGRRVPAAWRSELKAAEDEMKSGRPASSDPQADMLSWVSFGAITPATFGKALPVWLAAALDTGFNGALMAIGFLRERPKQQKPPVKRRKRRRVSRRKVAKLYPFPGNKRAPQAQARGALR
jgi:cell division protein FtsL